MFATKIEASIFAALSLVCWSITNATAHMVDMIWVPVSFSILALACFLIAFETLIDGLEKRRNQ